MERKRRSEFTRQRLKEILLSAAKMLTREGPRILDCRVALALFASAIIIFSARLLSFTPVGVNNNALVFNEPPALELKGVPARLRELLLHEEVVGERLAGIKEGTLSVHEALHGTKNHSERSDKPPMTIEEIVLFLVDFLEILHDELAQRKRAQPPEIWETYHELVTKTLYPFDREYLQRMPERRNDGSIFLSVASYRDEECSETLKNAYEKARNPDNLFVGLVQQNCIENCMSGVRNGKYEKVPSDEDCYESFCSSSAGKSHCDSGRVRLLRMTDTQSLGPYAARYFASKLWFGEEVSESTL